MPRLQTEHGKLFGVAVVGCRSIETLKATGTESDFFARWSGHQAESDERRPGFSVSPNAVLVPPPPVRLTAAVLLGARRRCR